MLKFRCNFWAARESISRLRRLQMAHPSQEANVHALIAENERLKRENQILQSNMRALMQMSSPAASQSPSSSSDAISTGKVGGSKLTIVVLGASGDLSGKKTYPALFSLYFHKLIPRDVLIAGFARSKIEHPKFIEKISAHFDKTLISAPGGTEARDAFLSRCFYSSCDGGYKDVPSFEAFARELKQREGEVLCNRVFYFALPPDAYVDVATSLKAAELDQPGTDTWMRAGQSQTWKYPFSGS